MCVETKLTYVFINVKKKLLYNLSVTKIFEDTVSRIEDDGLDMIYKIPQFETIKSGLYNHRSKNNGVKEL